MKEFTAQVTVIEKRTLTVCFRASKAPDKKRMLEILKNELYDDILDEETVSTESVENVSVKKYEEED